MMMFHDSLKLTSAVCLGIAGVMAIVGALWPCSRYLSLVGVFFFASLAILIALRALRWELSTVENKLSDQRFRTVVEVSTETYSTEIILRRFPQCAIPVSGWSMRFANLHAIIDLLDTQQPELIVEFSTICVSAWLKERGHGRLVSFDHDVEWAATTGRHLEAGELNRFAEVICAPMKSGEWLGQRTDWYSVGPVISSLSAIDFVIVDGPPASTPDRRLSRLPAIPAVHSRLSARATVVLDDFARPGEQEVVERWCKEYPDFALCVAGGSTLLAVLERKPLTNPIG